MLVPQFRLGQDANHIQVMIRLPYLKVSAVEFHISSNCFKFYLKPYLLSLDFEQRLKEMEEPASAQYDHSKHILKVRLLKETPGEEFTKLELLPRLLIGAKKNKPAKDKKAVLVCERNEIIYDESQQVRPFSYGFGNNYEEVFTDYEQETLELFDFNPQTVPVEERLKLSEEVARQQFDQDSYLFDLYENQEIEYVLRTQLELQKIVEAPLERTQFLELLKITPRHLLLSRRLIRPIAYQLFNICFCYLYELICMAGELGTESALTISRTCSVFRCNVNFLECKDVKQVLIECYRRCITHSLYKHLAICQKVKTAMERYFGQELAIDVLCRLRKLFAQSQVRHFLNTIYVDDYLVYLSESDGANLKEVRNQLHSLQITPQQLDLGLETSAN